MREKLVKRGTFEEAQALKNGRAKRINKAGPARVINLHARRLHEARQVRRLDATTGAIRSLSAQEEERGDPPGQAVETHEQSQATWHILSGLDDSGLSSVLALRDVTK